MNRGIKILLLIFLTNCCHAQFSNNKWCFGDSAGIDFSNVTNPVTFTTAVKSRGSCASIADSTNHLLFYAFTRAGLWGPTTLVYNTSNQLMQNGDSIVGEGWYQELVIVPNPSSNNLFYLFSISVTGSSGSGLYYSKIDMSQNGGLGAVMQKNNQLTNLHANESLSAIKHANGRDWWVFFRHSDTQNPNNDFFVYLIDPSGIHPVWIQNVGPLNYGNDGGTIEFNKSGTQFSFTAIVSQLELFDFDRCTGLITHNTTIQPQTINPPYRNYQWSAFSPSGRYLYMSEFDTTSYLYQYDLWASNITASKILIDSFIFPQYCAGKLKLAPDNKIYMSNAYNDGINPNYPYADTVYNMYNMNLSVINQPDSPGLACNFTKYSFYLGGNRTYWGLPNNPDYTLGAVTGSVCDSLTGIADMPQKIDLQMEVYPNPASNYFTVKVLQNLVLDKVSVYSLVGEQVMEGNANSSSNELSVNVATLPKGIYLVKIKTNKGVGYKKLVLQ